MGFSQRNTTRDKASTWIVVMPLVEAMFSEFKEFSKKKPADAVSKSKVKIVNRLLSKCKATLEGEPSQEFLDFLDDDDLPQNSDVALVLSQYVAALKQFRSTYYGWNGHKEAWRLEGGEDMADNDADELEDEA